MYFDKEVMDLSSSLWFSYRKENIEKTSLGLQQSCTGWLSCLGSWEIKCNMGLVPTSHLVIFYGLYRLYKGLKEPVFKSIYILFL